MWNLSHLCRNTQYLKIAQSKFLSCGYNNGYKTSGLVSRQLVTQTKQYKVNGWKGLQLNNVIKSNGIFVRFCSSTPKPKSSKVVGYWLVGCSGMVFTAVVLGMVAGYVTLLSAIYYIIRLILKETDAGSK